MSSDWELTSEVVVTEEDVLADLEPAVLGFRADRQEVVSEPR